MGQLWSKVTALGDKEQTVKSAWLGRPDGMVPVNTTPGNPYTGLLEYQ